MTTTIAQLLKAWEAVKPKPVYVFCHPDEHERMADALTLMPGVRVVAHQLVPAGALWIAEDLPHMDHHQGE